MPTLAELQARIAALEEQLAQKPHRTLKDKRAEKTLRERRKARARQFREERFRRARLHLSLNRYAR